MNVNVDIDELIKRIQEEESYVQNQTLSYQEYLPEFIMRAQEDLEIIESATMELEKDQEKYDVIDAIFRSFHNIKGSSGFVGQDIIQKMAHQTETLLDGCRKKTVKVSKNVINLILKSADIIKELCDDLELSEDDVFLERTFLHIKDVENEEINSAVNKETNETEKHNKKETAEFSENFYLKIKEYIENIENNILLSGNENAENIELSDKILNDFCAIKCSANLAEQILIEKIADQTKTFLEKFKEKTIELNKKIVNIILTSSEYIKKINEQNSLAEEENFVKNVNDYLQEIEKLKELNDDDISAELASKPPKIGEMLVEYKKLNPEDVEEIIEKQKTEYPDLKFGQIAVKEKKVEAKDVFNAINMQKTKSFVAENFMRISTDKVDNLVDMIGELLINQSLVEQLATSKFETETIFINNFSRMTRITKDIQNLSMDLRMVPLKSTFQKISRIARDTITSLGKEIEFFTSGDETEIDRIITEKLFDPLVHLVKNAISHGIEPEEERIKANKDPKGKVKVFAYNKRGSIYIEVTDDGGGINTDKVYQKALSKGLIDSAKNYSEREIQEFILLPGLSTVDTANNISGRGVGMDVVKTEIQKNSGKVEIRSEKGKGSTFILKIPVNHAIMNGTIVDIEGSNYIIPTLNIKQIIQPTEDQWVYIQGSSSMIKVREEIIPLVSISNFFDTGKEDEQPKLVVIVESDQKYSALPIRNVINRQEIVVKPVGDEFSRLNYVSGMSILGNGKVSLILDIESMFVTKGD